MPNLLSISISIVVRTGLEPVIPVKPLNGVASIQFRHLTILSFRLDSNQRDLSVPDYKSGAINLYATEACRRVFFLSRSQLCLLNY